MKFIVYQGFNEKYRWRKVDDEGKFVEQSELLDSIDEAIDSAHALDPELEIENRVEETE